MSSFKNKMNRTRKYREDGSRVYNTLNSTSLVNKYKNINSRFNTRHQKNGPCTNAGCGKQCCKNYFLISGIHQGSWNQYLSYGTIFAPGNTIRNGGKIIGIIEDVLFPNSNCCVPLGIVATSNCDKTFPLDIRLIVNSGRSCAKQSYVENSTLIIDDIPVRAGCDDFTVNSIQQEASKTLGSSRVGAPYRAPIAGYRKTLTCCDAKDYEGCFIECDVKMSMLKIYPNKGDYTYLQSGEYFGQVSNFKYTKINSGYNLVIIFTFNENDCPNKISLLGHNTFTLYSGDNSVYQDFTDKRLVKHSNPTKQTLNDVYKDSYALSCQKDVRVCYDKRIRSGMQPKQQFCVSYDDNGKRHKKLLCPGSTKYTGWQKPYSYSYSQYNKNRAMNTYNRGLERNLIIQGDSCSAVANGEKNCLKSQYRKSGGDACLNCVTPNSQLMSRNSITVWKPNNDKFKVQGAVSSGSRLDRLKLDTIRAGNSKCKKGQRCDENGNGNGRYFAGRPRFDGWMFNARHREVICENKYRQQPFGIPQLTNKGRSTRPNKAPVTWKDKSVGVYGSNQRSAITTRAPACKCAKKTCCAHLCPGETLPLSQGGDNNNARYTPSRCSKLIGSDCTYTVQFNAMPKGGQELCGTINFDNAVLLVTHFGKNLKFNIMNGSSNEITDNGLLINLYLDPQQVTTNAELTASYYSCSIKSSGTMLDLIISDSFSIQKDCRCDGELVLDQLSNGSSKDKSFIITVATDLVDGNSGDGLNGIDNNNLLHPLIKKDNIKIVTPLTDINYGNGKWNWTSSNALALGANSDNLNFIQFGNGTDTSSYSSYNDGTKYNSKLLPFYDPQAPKYDETSNIRVIHLKDFETIVSNNQQCANTINDVTLISLTVVYKVGLKGYGGDRPDMNTHLVYGRLPAAENLYVEFHNANHVRSLKTPSTLEFNSGPGTLTRGGVRSHHFNFPPLAATTIIKNYTSFVNPLHETKEMLPYRMVDYGILRNSPLYQYALKYGGITQIATCSWYHNATQAPYLSKISDLSTKNVWKNIINQSSISVYEKVYGKFRSSLFINAVGKKTGGIFGNPTLSPIQGVYTPGIWNTDFSFKEQPLVNRHANALLTGNPGNFLSTDPRYGSLHRDLVQPDGKWKKKVIVDIPKEAKFVRIFQDRYTKGGGLTANDNYAIAYISATFAGTYK